MLPEFFSNNGFVLEGFLTHCSFDYLSRDHFTRAYIMISFCVGFFIPLIVIIVLNTLIFKILKTKNEQFFSKRVEINKRSRNNDSDEIKKIRDNKIIVHFTNHKLNELKILKTIVLMCSLFCLSWGPYSVMTLFAQYGNHIERYINPYTVNIPALFAKTSTFTDPIVYLLLNKECRDHFYSLIAKKNNIPRRNSFEMV